MTRHAATLLDLLPLGAVGVQTRREREIALSAAERRALGRPTARRCREFVSARACARDALSVLGTPVRAADGVPAGPDGRPLWPEGVVGSITHCEGFRACAVGRRAQLAGLGIDAEPHRPLPLGVLNAVSTGAERDALPGCGLVRWDLLLFGAKEAAYKASSAVVGRRLGFRDAEVRFAPHTGTLTVRVNAPETPAALPGRWTISEGLALVVVWMESAT
jgi:4'-phosphopantetheinyl transferase EntD